MENNNANHGVRIVESAMEIIHDQNSTHPNREKLKQIISEYTTPGNNVSYRAMIATLDNYIEQKTPLATEVEDRRKVVAFGNTFKTIENFNNININNNAPVVQVYKPLVDQLKKAVGNYFEGESSTPTTIESIVKTTAQAKALERAQLAQQVYAPQVIAYRPQPIPAHYYAQQPQPAPVVTQTKSNTQLFAEEFNQYCQENNPHMSYTKLLITQMPTDQIYNLESEEIANLNIAIDRRISNFYSQAQLRQ